MEDMQKRIAASARALSGAFRTRQVDLAELLGVSQVAVSRKLNGGTRWSPEDVATLASFYGVSIDQVMAGPKAWLGMSDQGEQATIG